MMDLLLGLYVHAYTYVVEFCKTSIHMHTPWYSANNSKTLIVHTLYLKLKLINDELTGSPNESLQKWTYLCEVETHGQMKLMKWFINIINSNESILPCK